uniref:Uncharacterized protein n=1 Tax=Macrostomum lignano TaxID=282301 RepID=A0A1I8H0R2_9PLAT
MVPTSAASCEIGSYWSECSRRYQGANLFDNSYNFGWNLTFSLKDMCRLRSHVKLLKCLHDLINQRCAEKMDFLTIQTVLDYKRYERAADFICQEGNIQ